MEPSPSNSRYILELERNELKQQQHDIDEKYGTSSFIFLVTVENVALLSYLFIATSLIYYKSTRTKTNLIISIWAFINAVVLVEKLLSLFGSFFESDLVISDDTKNLCQMIAALGRSYGTSLSVVWLFSKYFETPKPRYNLLIFLLILLPAFSCFYFIFYFFNVNRYIYEVYGPGCDVVNLAVYILVGFIFIVTKIFRVSTRSSSQYALMVSLVNLITNLPVSLMVIYLRFNLDISWAYKFHIYFVDFLLNIINCSNAFVVLFLLILYNEELKNSFFKKKTDNDDKINYC